MVTSGRDESPVIGGHNIRQAAQQPLGKLTSADSGTAARPRPTLSSTSANKEEQKKAVVGGAAKRTGYGFGGFKAPPATDLIDQLLLEQD